jgi:hypothetical protein
MNKIIQVLNLKNPEGVKGCFVNSKFQKFEIDELKEFVIKNFLQTRYSQIFTEKENQKLLNNSEKEHLIICCIQIELTRSLLFNFSSQELEFIFNSNFN